MTVRKYKPVTNAQRDMEYIENDQVSNGKPQTKSLLKAKKKITGRGGSITIRHRGGGCRRHYRMIDFNGTDKLGVPGKVKAIEYDPNRSAFIALVFFADGDKRYQLAHKAMKVDDEVITDVKTKAKEGYRMQLKNIPVGFPLFNVEVTAGKGGQVVRSAGQSAKLVSLDGPMAQVQFPSGEIRYIEKTNYATIGVVSNEENNQIRLGKAGRVRHKGRRPQVRGKAMNPTDHPHGGGEGGSPIGLKHPKTPWGAPALGVKTRKKKKSDKYLVRSRHRAKSTSSQSTS